MIPSYSPQARGRSERNFSTWQGRLPQELRLHRIRTLEGANKFLNETTSPSSTGASQSRQRSEERHLYPAGTGIWRWSLRKDSSAPLIGITR